MRMETPVLIVGGGPVGLLSAIMLARLGVDSLLIERKSGTAIHPKARGITVRSMEILRQCGLETAVRAAAPSVERVRNYAVAASLKDPDMQIRPFAIGDLDPMDVSPTTGLICGQDALEMLLLEAARSLAHISIRLQHEVLDIAQSSSTAAATVRDRTTGDRHVIRAQFVIAADGGRSPVRTRLGIPLTNQQQIHHNINAMFVANLKPVLEPLNCVFVIIKNEHTAGALSAISTCRHDNEWTYNFQYFPERGESAGSFDADACADRVRLATGIPDLNVTVTNISEWQASSALLQSFRADRVLFAGDAAHLLTPAGGLGMNTGLADVHNLAWRIAAVLQGAEERLLDDYACERRTEAARVMEATVENLRRAQSSSGLRAEGIRDLWSQPQHGLTLGYRLDSCGVIPDGTEPPCVQDRHLYVAELSVLHFPPLPLYLGQFFPLVQFCLL